MKKIKALIIDDEELAREVIKSYLGKEGTTEVEEGVRMDFKGLNRSMRASRI